MCPVCARYNLPKINLHTLDVENTTMLSKLLDHAKDGKSSLPNIIFNILLKKSAIVGPNFSRFRSCCN